MPALIKVRELLAIIGMKHIKETMTTAKNLGEGTPTKQIVSITFKREHISDYPSYCIVHKSIKGYSLNGPYLIVQTDDDTQYVYPMSSIAELKFTNTKE